MITKKPMVSIIVATYRRDNDLQRALESIVNLNYKEYEIILVDDNDEELWNAKVQFIKNKFKENNTTIKIKTIINHSNMGSARTRNIGISVASGEYICFLDDDDIYLPSRITNQLNPMIANNADYSITDLALYNENNKLIGFRKRDYIKNNSKEELLKYHLMYHMTGTDTLMFKKDYLLKIGCFDSIDVGDEFYLMNKAIEYGGNFLYVPTCDVKAYVHKAEGGLSSGKGKIVGENKLYEHKEKFFGKLVEKDIKYIKVRHHLVLARAYLRNRKIRGFLIESIKAVSVDFSLVIGIVGKRYG